MLFTDHRNWKSYANGVRVSHSIQQSRHNELIQWSGHNELIQQSWLNQFIQQSWLNQFIQQHWLGEHFQINPEAGRDLSFLNSSKGLYLCNTGLFSLTMEIRDLDGVARLNLSCSLRGQLKGIAVLNQ